MKRRRIHFGFFQRLNGCLCLWCTKTVLFMGREIFLKRPFFSYLSMILIEQTANLQKDSIIWPESFFWRSCLYYIHNSFLHSLAYISLTDDFEAYGFVKEPSWNIYWNTYPKIIPVFTFTWTRLLLSLEMLLISSSSSSKLILVSTFLLVFSSILSWSISVDSLSKSSPIMSKNDCSEAQQANQ